MRPLTPADLLSLEDYDRVRPEFRRRAIAHQNRRRVHVGPDVTLAFEDRLTVHYQIQEMLRIERIFEREAIAEELAAYNPLVPDGTCLTATMMLEFPDPEERRRALVRLRGIEENVTLRVGDFRPVRALADEDLPRENEEKTASVHYLRFPLDEKERTAFLAGPVTVAIDHPSYRHATSLDEAQRALLARDFAEDPSGR
jgi:hypothetical protein